MQQDAKTEDAPLMLSAIVCERLILDIRTGRKTIKNIIETINVVKLPALLRGLMLYFEFTDLHRNTRILIQVVDTQENDEVLAEIKDVVPYKHPRQVVRREKVLPPIVLRHEGEYRIEIYAVKRPTILLGGCRVVCRKIEPYL